MVLTQIKNNPIAKNFVTTFGDIMFYSVIFSFGQKKIHQASFSYQVFRGKWIWYNDHRNAKITLQMMSVLLRDNETS